MKTERPQMGRSIFFINMQKVSFSKQAFTVKQQISQLKQRGMKILDETLAEKKLLELNYYRLEGYWLPLEIAHSPHKFNSNAIFEDVLQWYEMDRKLRNFLFEAIGIIEVSLRTKWAYYMTIKYKPYSYLDSSYAIKQRDWKSNVTNLCSEVLRSSEMFVEHFQTKYKEFLPPEWAVSEVISFGTLSHFYSNLNNASPLDINDKIPAKDAIAKDYGIDSHVLESWMHTINVVRNSCAHQSRLMNNNLKVQPVMPKSVNNKISITSVWNTNCNKWYNSILIIDYLYQKITENADFHKNIKNLILINKKFAEMLDFPKGWEKTAFWQN